MKKYAIAVVLCLQILFCSAQTAVPVREEPRHHKVLENTYVRILDVHIPPGDTSLFHRHETPSVFIVLHPVKTGSEVVQEEKKATALSPDASVSFEGFYTTPRIHRVWNEDTAEFHVMDVEILHTNPEERGAPIERKGLKLLLDEKPVRAYRLTLAAGESMQLKGENPFLIVGLADASQPVAVNNKAFGKRGDYLFVPAGTALVIGNKGNQAYAFAVLELK